MLLQLCNTLLSHHTLTQVAAQCFTVRGDYGAEQFVGKSERPHRTQDICSPLLSCFWIGFAAEWLSEHSIKLYKNTCMWIYLSTISWCVFFCILLCCAYVNVFNFFFCMFHTLIYLCRLAQIFDPTWRIISICSEEACRPATAVALLLAAVVDVASGPPRPPRTGVLRGHCSCVFYHNCLRWTGQLVHRAARFETKIKAAAPAQMSEIMKRRVAPTCIATSVIIFLGGNSDVATSVMFSNTCLCRFTYLWFAY